MSTIAGNRVNVEKYLGKVDGMVILTLTLYGFFSQYFSLCVLSGLTLMVIFRRLWRPFIPPVFFYFMVFHWIQVFFSIVYADFLGVSIDTAYDSSDTETLFAFTFLQQIVMTIVLSYYLDKVKLPNVNRQILVDAAKKLNTNNIIIGYVIASVIIPPMLALSYASPSLSQLVRTFFVFKNLFVALLFFSLLLKKTKNKGVIVVILILDFLLSFASFFSDFKEVIFLIGIAYLTVFPKLKTGTIMKMLPVVAILFIFLSFWSFVKGDYRQYLNQGEEQQVVRVSNTQALSYIFNQFLDFNTEALRLGGEKLLSRMQYMERYSEVYDRVPRVIEHQEGKGMEQILEFVIVPRFLNPDKGVKDASGRTAYYTGKHFRRVSQGTSISMGYFCDLYIDYGLYFMFLPLMALMAILGIFLTHILNRKGYNILFLYALLIGLFLTFGTFESDMVFFLGMLRNNAAFIVLGFAVLFQPIHKFVTNSK